MNYVIAAYVVTILLVGGYALSIIVRRRAVERDLAARRVGAPVWGDARGVAAAPAGTAGQVDPGNEDADAAIEDEAGGATDASSRPPLDQRKVGLP